MREESEIERSRRMILRRALPHNDAKPGHAIRHLQFQHVLMLPSKQAGWPGIQAMAGELAGQHNRYVTIASPLSIIKKIPAAAR